MYISIHYYICDVMGDRHRYLGWGNASDLAFVYKSYLCPLCTLEGSSMMTTFDCRATV